MLSSDQKNLLSNKLRTLLENSEEITAALVTTVDGHLCAMHQRENYPLDRLATMGSSLMSLGDTITAELKMGGCRNIISENESGIVTFMHINESLVLVTITLQKNSLGLLLAHSRKAAEEMANLIK
jgi:predicted regulator of Ras-like GTPase activity (Roadblock/LC7/MglB family)